MSGATRLDHVGIVTRDLAGLAGQFERLGFCLTPLARQTDGRIGNRCVMLRNGYVELLAVVDPNAVSATLDRFLARHAGIHILAMAIADEQTELARLQRAGVTAGVSQTERSVDDADPSAPRARFAIIPLPDQPEGRINLVRHLTPEALWQERFLQHPNSAAALRDVVVAVAEPAEAAARFSRLAGCPVVPDPAGGYALDLPECRVRLLSDAVTAALLPGVEVPTLPWIASLGIATGDASAAIGGLLADRGIPHRQCGDGLMVDPAEAGGVALRFVQ